MEATVNKKTSSKEYELTNEMDFMTGLTLYRIRALKDFGDVKKGDLGGFIEKESNLSHKGNCWVYDKARVFQNAKVSGNAKVKSYFVDVCGNAKIYDNASVSGHAHISDDAVICDDAQIGGNAKISGAAHIGGHSQVCDDAVICGATVSGYSCIHSDASLSSDDDIYDAAVPEFGSDDDYYRHEYYDDYEYDCNSEDANQAA
ncbi:hypothetical protein NPX99_08070 [Bartonella sp. 220]|uniref:hypothetical protein n=1 Tax=Bartonella sp. 220B TaxID=2967260 RepID=UPI0022A98D5E|nr:hypothetical protein [Bartonella sp. 220B]MCZ2159199.1 hypothetical protein [Bartonella sp. 220B]